MRLRFATSKTNRETQHNKLGRPIVSSCSKPEDLGSEESREYQKPLKFDGKQGQVPILLFRN